MALQLLKILPADEVTGIYLGAAIRVAQEGGMSSRDVVRVTALIAEADELLQREAGGHG
jgi:hypothetical protein